MGHESQDLDRYGTTTVSLRDGCDAFLERYAETLRRGGDPFVLAEGEGPMDKLGISELKAPDDFWHKLNSLPAVRRRVPAAVARAFRQTLPDPRLAYRVVRREAGTGSLGQVRYVAIAIGMADASLEKRKRWCRRHPTG